MERLDRGYASSDWMIDFPEAHICNMPIIHSDHGPILLHLLSPKRQARRPYQVENWCLHLNEVKKFVQNIWKITIVGSTAYVLCAGYLCFVNC